MTTAEDLLDLYQLANSDGSAEARQGESLLQYYKRVRQQSLKLCQDLEIEDYELQADAFVSPIKWHLANTLSLINISRYPRRR